MLHPLESVLYFVHGYHGNTSQWNNMYDYLLAEGEFGNYDSIKRFDYADYWMNENPEWDIDDVHTYCTITDLAMGFVFDIMDSNFAPGTQIDIVSHSMGGLITRELLRVYRSDLQYYHDVDFGRVITLGTPHEGTNLAEGSIPSVLLLILMSMWGPNWDSLLLNTMAPGSSFLTTLNANPSDYSNDIMWTTIAGLDLVGDILTNFHGGPNDKIVAYWSAHLSFADRYTMQYLDHEGLLIDPSNSQPDRPFDIVAEALGPEIDSDNDGLSDIEEKYVYGTDPNDSDSDNDGLSDFDEIKVYSTNPNHSNSDGDAISDGNEVAWGYNPTDGNDPIPAPSLVSSVSYTSSTRNVRVYVNHFTNMDKVKFYVKYYNSYGWTSYSYMGTDYTPTTGGDYYDSWTHPSGYTKMTIYVKAYDSSGHYLGSDYYTCGISSGGGGGGGGRPPLD